MTQFQVDYQTKKLNIVAVILKYKKYFIIILLLYILWIVRHYRSCYLELYRINKEWRDFSPQIDE